MLRLTFSRFLKSIILISAISINFIAIAHAEPLQVYTSTNVWASVVKAIGGDDVTVIAGVNNLNQDPHDYEASVKDKLDISKSVLIVVNGGGYDDWAKRLATSTNNQLKILDTVNISEKEKTDDGDFNEHIFFSLDSVKKVASAIEIELSSLDKNNSKTFAANLKKFDEEINSLLEKAKNIGKGKSLKGIYTEPVVGYLMADMGIRNITPDVFIEQAETDAGPSAKTMLEMKKLLSSKQADILILNAQTEDNTSRALEKEAKAAGIPIVYVYETFPDGITSYTRFIEKTLNDFNAALNQK